VTVDGQGRVRLMSGEDTLDHLARRCQRGIVDGPFRIGRRVPRRQQHGVAFAQGNREVLGESQ
jgi:hypothetical protein